MKVASLPRTLSIDRAVALSDGVVAVVITLLVLGIEVPDGGRVVGPELAEVRAKLAHQILIYFVAFWVIAMHWSQHGILFSNLRRMDGVVLVLNLGFLVPVTLLPFVTDLMGERRDHWGPVFLFAMTNLVSLLMLRSIWKHASSRAHLNEGQRSAELADRMALGFRVFLGVMVVGVLLAFVDPRLGILCFLLTPFAHFFNYVRDALRAEHEPENNDAASA
jgi:uncharacterized membrane protein